MKPKNYTKTKKIISDWTGKKNYMVPHKILKFYVRHVMVVDKIHEIISFKQSKWLEEYRNFDTQKRKRAKSDFEKDFYNLLSNAFYGKCMENVRNCLKLDFIKKRWLKKLEKNSLNWLSMEFISHMNTVTVMYFKKMKL